MADPFTWVAAITAAVGAVSSIDQGIQQSRQVKAQAQSQANMAEYNAKMNQIQANQAYAAAGAKEEAQRAQARQQIGLQLASSAEAGAGLNPDLLRSSLLNTEADANAIRYEGNLQAQGLLDSAQLNQSSAEVIQSQGRSQASGLRTAGYFGAASSLLSGAGSYYKNQSLNRR